MSEPRRLFALAISAALVLAACGGEDEKSSNEPQAKQAETPAADIVVTGTNALEFEPSQVEVEAGRISVALSTEAGPHTFTVELDDGAETVAQVSSAGQPATGEIELEAGTYRFFCAIEGHTGMEGTLTVT